MGGCAGTSGTSLDLHSHFCPVNSAPRVPRFSPSWVLSQEQLVRGRGNMPARHVGLGTGAFIHSWADAGSGLQVQ